MKFGKAILPTPIFNHFALEDFLGHKEGSLSINQKGRLAYLEMIALEGSIFTLHESFSHHVYRITTDEYGASYPLYVDKRGLQEIEQIQERERIYPPAEEMLATLLLQRGRPYLWGGNLAKPLYCMEEWYPSPLPLSPYEKMVKTFNGIDCSGLIYFASHGTVPRNTSDMTSFGVSVPIEKGSLSDWDLRPLDLILDLGHVVIVIDKTWSIQAKEKLGVFLIKTKDIIDSLVRRKQPKNEWDHSLKEEIFIIRRFLNDETDFRKFRASGQSLDPFLSQV